MRRNEEKSVTLKRHIWVNAKIDEKSGQSIQRRMSNNFRLIEVSSYFCLNFKFDSRILDTLATLKHRKEKPMRNEYVKVRKQCVTRNNIQLYSGYVLN